MEDGLHEKSFLLRTLNYILCLLLLAGLYLVSRYNFLLFHGIAEIFSIVISCTVFMLTWNARRLIHNNYLMLVGISLLFVGAIDTMHTLAYKGMGVFPGQGADQATQLWIAARFLQALSFLAAPFLFGRKLRFGWICAGYAAATTLLFASIFLWKNFPACFVEGMGLTAFKKGSEYVISGMLFASGGMILARRDKFEKDVLELLTLSIVLMIAAELAFTFYISVYGLSNLIGHFFKILSFLLIYLAIVETGFSRPYGLIFREMKKNEEELIRAKEELEFRVQERTADLNRTNRMLSEEASERNRAFDALRESEERFHLLFTEMVSGFALHEILCDPQGKPYDYRFLEINPAFERITGLGREEILGKTALEVFPGAEEIWIRILGDVALSGKPAHLEEYSAALKKHFEVLAYSPKRGQFAVTFTDITEKKEAKEKIERSFRIESALRRIDENILSGAKYPDALEIACDAIMELGYRMCWIGMAEPDHSVRPAVYRGFEKGYLEEIRVRWDDSPEGRGPSGNAIRTGRTHVIDSIQRNPLYAPWRDEALKRGYLSSATIPLRTGASEVIGVLHVYSREEVGFDPEEVHTLEAFAQQCTIAVVNARRLDELREAHQKLVFHVNRMPLAYIVWNRDFRVVEWNPAAERIFGWTAAEALGKHPYEMIVLPEDQPLVNDVWAKLLEGDESSYSMNANLRKDGAKITCEWFNAPLKDAEGHISGILSMVHDVSERSRLERQLQTVQRMESVGTLAGGVAHDFNNALTGILGFSEMLRMRLSNDPGAISDLDEIARCAERASTLTKQLLTFARRQIIEPFPLNLNMVVTDLLRLMRNTLGAHMEIHTNLEGSLPAIMADQGQIEQVLMNLCLNARDAMPEGGKLLIETEVAELDLDFVKVYPYMQAGRFVVLIVADTGTGMDEKTRERVFEPFFTTKGQEKGTGLGLSMVYGIVKQHNGFIHLYSEPGKGTIFKIYFPVIEAKASRKAAPIDEPLAGGTEIILLAEDEETVRAFAERALKELGYNVLVAKDGEEACAVFEKNKEKIVLAVLDVVMPRKGGKMAFEEMSRSNPNIKVIFTSGYAPNAIHDSFVLIPGAHFLPKPYGPRSLGKKVREVLDG